MDDSKSFKLEDSEALGGTETNTTYREGEKLQSERAKRTKLTET